jgi:mannonate dehydratase
MKLGIGLYRHMLTPENFRFARQAGATHIVAHRVDYFRAGEDNPSGNQPTGGGSGWGVAGNPHALWTADELTSVRNGAEEAGLKLEAIENFDPAHWYDVLLDGPKRREHMENVKTLISRVGEAGIPILGYNFSLAGVCGRVTGPFARGGALSVGMDGPFDEPMPRGMAWNMVVDALAPKGNVPAITHEALWERFFRFLGEALPAAEKAGVKLAAHPDDPPMPFMRGQPRLFYQPHHYQKLIDFSPSASNMLEFCAGTVAEMTEGSVYEAVDSYSRQGRIAYVHLRNVAGKVPHYKETFIDDGDVDVVRVLRTLKANGFEGMVIPDHTPQMDCRDAWQAGMAHALGFIKGVLDSI